MCSRVDVYPMRVYGFRNYGVKSIMAQTDVNPVQIPAPWNDFINDDEKQRLTILEARYERKKRIIDDEVLSERRKIMRRAIKRMRRYEGKE